LSKSDVSAGENELAGLGLIVCKFGGSSLADAGQFAKVKAIVDAEPNRRVIVVSAPGKRTPDDKKITDLLYLCQSLVAQGMSCAEAFIKISDRYNQIAEILGCQAAILGELETVKDGIESGKDSNWVASRGEYLNGHLMASYLDAVFIDPADCILFGSDGRIVASETYSRVRSRIASVLKRYQSAKVVIPGFYGADKSGNIICFSRGGSDISGAIAARAVQADIYENWTDVSGLLMADPRLISNPKEISEVTYREQRELSYMGATVLHDEAVFPVREAGIPIQIRNTNDPNAPGTKIVLQRDASTSTIVGIAGKSGFAAIFTEKALMNVTLGYGRKMLEILESHGLQYEHAPTSIDTMSVIVRDDELTNVEDKVVAEINSILGPDRVEVYRNLSMIATVGEGMSRRVGMAGLLFKALADSGVNVRMINQGASEINIIVGVDTVDFPKAMNAIYEAFVEN